MPSARGTQHAARVSDLSVEQRPGRQNQHDGAGTVAGDGLVACPRALPASPTRTDHHIAAMEREAVVVEVELYISARQQGAKAPQSIAARTRAREHRKPYNHGTFHAACPRAHRSGQALRRTLDRQAKAAKARCRDGHTRSYACGRITQPCNAGAHT